jgi:hypothetical protein
MICDILTFLPPALQREKSSKPDHGVGYRSYQGDQADMAWPDHSITAAFMAAEQLTSSAVTPTMWAGNPPLDVALFGHHLINEPLYLLPWKAS